MKQTRQEAIKAREKHYNTGRPCKHGHNSKRNTADGSCVECRVESSSRQAEENKRIRTMLKEASNGQE